VSSPDCAFVQSRPQRDAATPFARFLRWFSYVAIAMTVPQALAVWRGGGAGVSLWTWATYLASACLWMAYGWRQRDKTIYLPCFGWIALDGAIVIGLLLK
jgi:hypothetical protein